MRKVAAVGAIAAVLVGAAVAHAVVTATAEVRYLSAVPATSAGIDLHISWTDLAAPGGRPSPIKTLLLRFHPGTRIATAAMVRCRASDGDVARRGRAACPSASRIGSGHSILATATAASIPARVTLYNAARQIIVLVETGGRTLAVYRDSVRKGIVTVHFALPPGISLVDLRLKVSGNSRRAAGRRHPYFRTPPTCPSDGSWTTAVSYTLLDGSTEDLAAATPCHR